MQKFSSLIFGLFLMLALFTATIRAQSATATLSGTVVDEQNAIVAGTSVTITDTAKAFERTTTTDGDGGFVFTQLAPSNYTVKMCKRVLPKPELKTWF